MYVKRIYVIIIKGSLFVSVCQMLTLSRYLTQNCSPNKYTFHLKLKFKQTKKILQYVGDFVLEFYSGAQSILCSESA